MPQGLQTVVYSSTSLTGGAFEALTAQDGTSFFVTQGTVAGYIAEVWAVDSASPAAISIAGSRFHDPTLGIVAEIPDGSTLAPAGRASLISPTGVDQPIYSGDTMLVQANGTAADEVVVTIIIRYEDIPGIAANLQSAESVSNQVKNLVGIQCAVTPGNDVYGTPVALNATDDRLHAGSRYAVLGFTADAPIACLSLQGPDTGNLRVGGPVLGDAAHDAYMFRDLAKFYNAPFVPVIQALNAGATTLVAADPNVAARAVTVIMAELSGA